MTGRLRDDLAAALGTGYTLAAELGGGGMSRVFSADDHRLGRRVVVKLLAPELAAGLSAERFEREIRVAAAMQHPLVVPLLSAGATGDGIPYYTMPFIQGESLRARLTGGPRFSVAEALHVLRDVCDAVAYAHERNVIHRDIKPENILLSGGHALIADFGIARAVVAAGTTAGGDAAAITGTGIAVGTPAYMSPEQAVGDPHTDHRADLYALGCVAYEMLANRPVFLARTPQELAVAHLVGRPRPIQELCPDVPPRIAATIMQCLEKLPANRPGSAAEVLATVDAAASFEGPAAAPASKPHMLPVAIAVVISIALVVLVRFTANALGLPDWTFPAALLAIVGGIAAFGWAHRRHPRRSWYRAAGFGVVAIGIVTLTSAVYMLLRVFGIGPVGSLLAAGALPQKPTIVIADFEVQNGDSALGPVLADAVRASLAQSRTISAMPLSAVKAGLVRMRRAPGTRLDGALARELAEREGAHAVIEGNVVPLGSAFVVTLRLLAAESGDELVSYRATASDGPALLPVLDDLTRRMRGKIGESLSDVRQSHTLVRATTGSLDAFRAYAAGMRANSAGAFVEATTLFERAVALDSTFASAYVRLATTLSNVSLLISQRVQPDKEYGAISRAYELRDRLPEFERLYVDAEYHTWVEPSWDRMMASYGALLALDSTVAASWNNIGMRYRYVGRHAESEPYFRRALQLAPDVQIFYANTATAMMAQGRLDEGDSVLRVMEHRFPQGAMSRRVLLWHLLLRRHMDSLAMLEPTLAPSFERAWIERLRGQLGDAWRMELGAYAAAAPALHFTPLTDSLPGVLAELWLAGPGASRLAHLDALVQTNPMSRIPPRERPYFDIATAYARAGQPDRARAFIVAYDREVLDSAVRREAASEREDALAEIALAEGRWHDAVAGFRNARRVVFPYADWCSECVYEHVARAFDAGGQRDSAIVSYDRYLTAPFPQRLIADTWYRARTVRRLAELYDAAGDRARAIRYYRDFVIQWRDADESLQPEVRQARARLSALASGR